ncbi:MAG: hypothetical protein OFPI_04970 [Osedax symbiont Rs2]|nr:MAG: hypothetical protein OFPI_04970 [Osedax symbiont Rs2]
MSLSASLNIAIVGAGLVGRLLAYQLSQHKLNISLYEANRLNSDTVDNQLDAAAFTAAGMIAPVSEALEADLDSYYLGKTSLQLWPSIVAELNLKNTATINYQQSGSLILCHPQDRAELAHFSRKTHKLASTTGAAFTTLIGKDIHQLEPDIGNGFEQGILLPDEAHIDNRALMSSLLQQCLKQGVLLIDDTLAEIDNNRVLANNKSSSYDWVFDCRGIGAKSHRPELRGVRGEVLRVHCPDVNFNRPIRLMHPRYQLYLVPKPGGQYVIGATQIESEDRSSVTVQSMLELCSAMYSINPAFAEARILEQNTNLRPALNDNKASILVCDRHVSINGLFRHGYLIAPAIVRSVIHWLEGRHCQHHKILFRSMEHIDA